VALVREGFRDPERACYQVISTGPELPQFTDRAALVAGAQAGSTLDQCALPTLQASTRREGEDRMQGERTTDQHLTDGLGPQVKVILQLFTELVVVTFHHQCLH